MHVSYTTLPKHLVLGGEMENSSKWKHVCEKNGYINKLHFCWNFIKRLFSVAALSSSLLLSSWCWSSIRLSVCAFWSSSYNTITLWATSVSNLDSCERKKKNIRTVKIFWFCHLWFLLCITSTKCVAVSKNVVSFAREAHELEEL